MDNKKSSNDILVKFSDVTKQYGDLVVLDKLNLEIKKNERPEKTASANISDMWILAELGL